MTKISLGEAPGVTCSIAAGETISATPSWNILEVNAGPDIDGCLPDEDVIGCSDPLHFGDQMLFGATTLRLRSVRLKMPELNGSLDLARSWSQAPVLAGLPKLSAPAVFELPKAIARVFDPHADVLLSLSSDSEPIEPMRLSVTEDLDLLFAEGAHVGCMLWFASRHLVSPLTGRAPIEASREASERRHKRNPRNLDRRYA